MKALRCLLLLIAVVTLPTLAMKAHAQSGGPGDMWTAYAEKIGAASPHVNYCNSSEVFVAIGGGSLGFCMDKDQSASAAEWTDAKDTCAASGKRLPEPAEFKFACQNPPSGLVNMTSDPEWASNSSTVIHFYNGSTNLERIVVPLMGNGSCYNGDQADTANSSNTSANTSFKYRCVR